MSVSRPMLATIAFISLTTLFVSCASNERSKAQTITPEPSVDIEDASVMPKYKALLSDIAEQRDIVAAFNTIEADRQKNNDLLVALTEIPAPPFGEEKRAEHFATLLRDAGLDDVTIDDVGNVIGRRPGILKDRTIAISAHLDTVFPKETDVTVKIDGDTYTAPGVGDNSRGLVVLLSVLRALEAHHIQTASNLLFIGNVGEEGLGDLRGTKHLYRDGGPQIDALVAIDGGQTNNVIYGGVGSYRYRVTFEGPGGHSWGAFGDANPHHALGRATALFAERAPQATLHGPKTSFNVGRIGGGTSINAIPFESWMEVDMRSGNKEKLDEIDSIFKRAVRDGLRLENDARQRGPELTVDIQKIGVRPVGKGDPRSPLVQHAMSAMAVLGLTPKLAISSTDANIPISMNLPAITIGRGGISRHAHSLHESWTDKNAHHAIQLALLVLIAQAGHTQSGSTQIN